MVHMDIKSSNIMLDSNFNTKLGDFGLAKLVDQVKGSQTTVALEIACGRKLIKTNTPQDQVVLVEWVWELYGIGKVLEAVTQGWMEISMSSKWSY
jgi:serine/threonine protein kinase